MAGGGPLDDPRQRLGAPILLQQTRAQQLGLEGAQEGIADLVDGEAVPILPVFGRRPQQRVFDGKRLGAGEEGVDTGGVRIHHGARVFRRRLVVQPGGSTHARCPQQTIPRHAARPRQLRPAAQCLVSVEIHLPQPVLRRGESLREEQVPLTLGADVGNAPPIPEDRGRRRQPGQSHGGLQIRQRCLQVPVSEFDRQALPS